jgi:hypothetical protein
MFVKNFARIAVISGAVTGTIVSVAVTLQSSSPVFEIFAVTGWSLGTDSAIGCATQLVCPISTSMTIGPAEAFRLLADGSHLLQ